MSIVGPLEGNVKLMAKRILAVVSTALRSGVYPLKLGPEVVRFLDLFGILSWRVLDVLNRGLPVDIGSDRVHECDWRLPSVHDSVVLVRKKV